MVVLRATRRLLPMLPAFTASVAASDTALGDWYVNRVVVYRQPVLLLVSSRSRLTVLAPARDVRGLPGRLPGLVAERLRRMAIADAVIAAEVAAMEPVVIAATQDRSVVGSMVDFAKALPFHFPKDGWDSRIMPLVESRLAGTPCLVNGPGIFPEARVPELLAARWSTTDKRCGTGLQLGSDDKFWQPGGARAQTPRKVTAARSNVPGPSRRVKLRGMAAPSRRTP